MTDPTESSVPPAPFTPPLDQRARIESAGQPKRRDPLPLLYLLGFVILAGTLAYLYRHPVTPPAVQQAAVRVDSLQQQVASLNDRLAALEAKPAPAADLAPLDRRIAALEGRPAAPAVNLAPLEGRVAAVEGRPAPPPVNLQPLEGRIGALEAKPAPAPFNPAPLTARIDDLAAKQGSAATALAGRLDAVEGRLGTVETQAKQVAGQVGAVAERSGRISRLQAAMAALESGQRLGDIPGAPPAIARFALDAPPTEQALRQSFDAAAAAAQHASQPAIMDNQSFGGRLWTRAQQAVSVRQGDNVLVGDPLSGRTARARASLDAGDLAGAVKALDGLTGPAAAALADWTGQARALLDARAALSAMAARS